MGITGSPNFDGRRRSGTAGVDTGRIDDFGFCRSEYGRARLREPPAGSRCRAARAGPAFRRRYTSLPQDQDPDGLTLEDAVALLEAGEAGKG